MLRALPVILVLMAVACSSGGSGDRTLHLRTGDITESAWRTELQDDMDAETCGTIAGMSVPAIAAYQDRLADETNFPEGGNDDDALRAAAILKEHCDRITG